MTARRSLRLLASLVALGACLALSGCNTDGISFLFPQGLVAARQRLWLFEVIALVAIVVVPTFILVPAFAWYYRRTNRSANFQPDWAFSWGLEAAIWGVPCAIVTALAFIIVIDEARFDPYAPLPGNGDPLEVEVIALNWKWVFIYPAQKLATVGELVIPQGRDVHFRLTSDSTMQSFFIPALGSQIYAMAGMVTQLHLRADNTGVMMGENTQFNGTGFSGDRFQVEVRTPAGFDDWVKTTAGQGSALSKPDYETMASHRTVTRDDPNFDLPPEPVRTYSSVEPDLFESIVAKYRKGNGGAPMSRMQ